MEAHVKMACRRDRVGQEIEVLRVCEFGGKLVKKSILEKTALIDATMWAGKLRKACVNVEKKSGKENDILKKSTYRREVGQKVEVCVCVCVCVRVAVFLAVGLAV